MYYIEGKFSMPATALIAAAGIFDLYKSSLAVYS